MEQSTQQFATMRQHADQIFQAGLQAVEPCTAILRCCSIDGDKLLIEEKTFDLSLFDKIIVLGAGKAGGSMAAAVEELLGDRLSGGIVTVKYDHLVDLQKITLKEAGHPIPDDNGLPCFGRRLRTNAPAY